MREIIETVIIGAGQAGLSLSYYLCQKGQEHIVLEKDSLPGSAWQNERWDSFSLVTPNWTFALPGGEYDGDAPDGFMLREEIVRRFAQYAERYQLPVRYHNAVSAVTPAPEGHGFVVQTEQGELQARNVVLAIGWFQHGRIPAFAADIPADILQIHSGSFRNAQALPAGAVLVVGSGQSGCQITEELYQSGRKVFLATGTAPAAPRTYRGQDLFKLMVQSGFMDRTVAMLPNPVMRAFAAPQITGKNGGHALSLHQFYRDGVTLLGHARGYADGKLVIAPDLHENLGKSDGGTLMLIKWVDEYVARAGLDLPMETLIPDRAAYQAPEITALDLHGEGITSIIWACGYAHDAKLNALLPVDETGFPLTDHGETAVPGLFAIGLPWQPKFRSGFIMGVAEEAEILAGKIAARAVAAP